MLLRQEADKLQLDDLLTGVIETIVTEDPLYALLSFQKTNGGQNHVYNREGTLPTANFVASGGTVAESAGTTEEITVRVKTIVDDLLIDAYAQDNDAVGNVVSSQIAMKSKAASRKFRDTVINGSAYTGAVQANNPTGFITAVPDISYNAGKGIGVIKLNVSANTVAYQAPEDSVFGTAVDFSGGDGTFRCYSDNATKWIDLTLDISEKGLSDAEITIAQTENTTFPGLQAMIDPAQRVYNGANATTAAALNFAKLDEVYSTVPEGLGSDDNRVNITAKRTINSFKSLMRGLGGAAPEMIQLQHWGRPVLAYEGVPILKNEFIATNEGVGSACNSWYHVYLDDMLGLTGLYAGNKAGVDVAQLGLNQSKDAYQYRVRFWAALALYAKAAAAELYNINN